MCPERTLEGIALEELRFLPQIIGSPDIESREKAAQLFLKMTSSVIMLSSYEAAELAKLSNNISRDVKFALANEIALACEKIGINFEEVRLATTAGYPRDGLAKPGPVAGPCLEKDSWIFLESLNEFTKSSIASKFDESIIRTARKINENLPEWVLHYIFNQLTLTRVNKIQQNILHVGIAFKGNPPTDDIRGSDAIKIVKRLILNPHLVNYVWDAEISPLDLQKHGFTPMPHVDLKIDFDMVIVHNNHLANQDMIDHFLNNNSSNIYIFDLWNLWPSDHRFPANVFYKAFGNMTRE
jgi:nucleotide sugar dehydrogenase